MYSKKRHIVQTREAILMAKPSRIRIVAKYIILIIISAVFIASFFLAEQYDREAIKSARALLGCIALGVVFFRGRRVYVPSPIEFQFYADHMIIYRPRRRYSFLLTRREYYRIEYLDVRECVYSIESKQLSITGKMHGVWYNMKADGFMPPEPSYNQILQDETIEIATNCASRINFKKMIEAHTPLYVTVKCT